MLARKRNYLDYKDFEKLTDNELKLKLSYIGVKSITDLLELENEKRNLILEDLKKLKGVSVRQLSRIKEYQEI